ncbi:dynamin family protein [Trichocoleus sp. DQ-U1]|uniref:dynamin family protein n=1 Tax=Trichocoleus sp. DQ-U1 TaxID=2933926 RepID=UPI00329A157A
MQTQKYQVAVIAAMKAGKSTFLNAVIGADVLASESAACTICRTDVLHIDAGQIPRLLEYQEGKRQPIVIAEGDAGEIQQKFLLRTREIREKGNPDDTTRFEIEYPIQAISALSSLSGFTLVDTPGPNEWESANFNTVALKQTALEALRTCNAILFVLNYAAYKDNAISDLFKEVIRNRQELLAENKGKIYFILNKVDQKTERDREIPDVIEDLKKELAGFGFPNPIIYPASSRQGLLAKLIEQGKATESQIKDFRKFFSAQYATEDEEGNQITPAPRKIAPQALKDSGIPTIQETVIQTITQHSGWNLLSDVLAGIDKSAKAVEDTLNTQISGWDMEIETLRQKVEDYRKRSESAKSKVEVVKKSVEEQKQILIRGFSQGISIFAKVAKDNIQDEIDQIAKSRSATSARPKIRENSQSIIQTSNKVDWSGILVELGRGILEMIPVIGKGLKTFLTVSFKAGSSLSANLRNAVPEAFDSYDSAQNVQNEILDTYKIRIQTKEEAKKIERTINEFCAPHIQSW